MAKAPYALADRLFTRADLEVKRLEVEQSHRENIFESARTRLHAVNAELNGAKRERARWAEARERAALPRIGRAS